MKMELGVELELGKKYFPWSGLQEVNDLYLVYMSFTRYKRKEDKNGEKLLESIFVIL